MGDKQLFNVGMHDSFNIWDVFYQEILSCLSEIHINMVFHIKSGKFGSLVHMMADSCCQ